MRLSIGFIIGCGRIIGLAIARGLVDLIVRFLGFIIIGVVVAVGLIVRFFRVVVGCLALFDMFFCDGSLGAWGVTRKQQKRKDKISSTLWKNAVMRDGVA
ncbi:MAG: hypothetical protein KAG53_09465 [Endozoicomonadaceae bacterium]|nr:hypothetical protein [Endozoicomonadaceae bacterium]